MIFISHSSKDDSVASVICEYLEKEKVKCWIDHRDAELGSRWEESIVLAIRSSRIMLLVFSHNANISKHVGRELTLAAKNDLNILPIKIENSQVSEKFEYYIEDIQWLNAVSYPIEKYLSIILAYIKKNLNQPSGTPKYLEVQNLFNIFREEINNLFDKEKESAYDFTLALVNSEEMQKYFGIEVWRQSFLENQKVKFMDERYIIIPKTKTLKKLQEYGKHKVLLSGNTLKIVSSIGIQNVLEEFFDDLISFVKENFDITITQTQT